MRYSELVSTSFFLSSDDEREGIVACADLQAGLQSSDIEALLERNRPPACRPRANSLLLHEHPVGDKKYCYKISALGTIDRKHTGWFKSLAETPDDQVGVLKHKAGMFWKGLECKDFPLEPWEVRTYSVQIISRVGGSSRTRMVPPKADV